MGEGCNHTHAPASTTLQATCAMLRRGDISSSPLVHDGGPPTFGVNILASIDLPLYQAGLLAMTAEALARARAQHASAVHLAAAMEAARLHETERLYVARDKAGRPISLRDGHALLRGAPGVAHKWAAALHRGLASAPVRAPHIEEPIEEELDELSQEELNEHLDGAEALAMVAASAWAGDVAGAEET